MYLRAISIGYAVPDGNFAAVVHSVFQSALNLRLNGGNLLTLVLSSESDLPQGIRLNTPEGFSFEGFQAGNALICRDGLLRFEKNPLSVQLSGARRWKCDLPAVGRTGSPTYAAAWNFVWEALNARQMLAAAEIVAEELFQASTRTGVSRKAGEAMRKLVSATRQYSLDEASLKGLIGLGPGLTPSGDDLLVGYMAGLWCTVQDQSQRMQFITDFGEAIVRLSSGTNDISRAYLYHAAHGQVSSRLANLAEAICQGNDLERLHEIAEAAFQVGHTSGVDAVTGLLIGMADWTNLGAFP